MVKPPVWLLSTLAACSGASAATAGVTEEAPRVSESPSGAEANEATENPQSELMELAETIEEASSASERAEGETRCEQAFNALMAVGTVMEERGLSASVPDQNAFLTSCNQLPERAQTCLRFDYAVDHLDECADVLSTPEVAEFRRTVYGTDPREAYAP